MKSPHTLEREYTANTRQFSSRTKAKVHLPFLMTGSSFCCYKVTPAESESRNRSDSRLKAVTCGLSRFRCSHERVSHEESKDALATPSGYARNQTGSDTLTRPMMPGNLHPFAPKQVGNSVERMHTGQREHEKHAFPTQPTERPAIALASVQQDRIATHKTVVHFVPKNPIENDGRAPQPARVCHGG